MEQTEKAALAEMFINHTNKHVFLTGRAGTGKTTFLKYIIQNTHKKTIVAAPTGIAALNAGGVTLHSQFQLPPSAFLPTKQNFQSVNQLFFETQSSIMRHMRMNNVKRSIIREAELLIIDEVSMLRADVLDAIDFVLKNLRRNNQSFGGIQVLFIGDLLQLPPIVKDEEWEVLKTFYKSPHFFDAKALEKDKPFYVELDVIHRQSDQEFIDLLNAIRYNQLSNAQIEKLNHYYRPDKIAKAESYVTLTTHNRKADEINATQLAKLSSKSWAYEAEIKDDFPQNVNPCERTLILKEGAQVMFVKNDVSNEKKYFNGKLGIVKSLNKEAIVVEAEDGTLINVVKDKWENIRYILDEETNEIKEEVLGSFNQYPLRLAWAITIHKSQGLTFEKAIIDIKNVFAAGQSYVAMSRLKSLEGLILLSEFPKQGINNNESILAFEDQKKVQGNSEEILRQERWNYIHQICMSAFNFDDLYTQWEKHLQSYKSEEHKSVRAIHFEWAREQFSEITKLMEGARGFKRQLTSLFQGNEYSRIQQRLLDARKYYIQEFKSRCLAIYTHIAQCSNQKKTKKYIESLKELEAELYGKLQSIQKASVVTEHFFSKKKLSKDEWAHYSSTSWRTEFLQNEHLVSEPKAERIKEVKKKVKGETFETTLALFLQNLSIDQIAKERNLSKVTITEHFVRLVELKKMDVLQLMAKDRFDELYPLVSKYQHLEKLTEIKEKLEEHLASYDEIKFIKAYLNAQK